MRWPLASRLPEGLVRGLGSLGWTRTSPMRFDRVRFPGEREVMVLTSSRDGMRARVTGPYGTWSFTAGETGCVMALVMLMAGEKEMVETPLTMRLRTRSKEEMR